MKQIPVNSSNSSTSERRKKFVSSLIVFIIVLGLSGFGIEGITKFRQSYIIKAGSKKITPERFADFLDSQKKEYISRFGSGIIEPFLNKKDFLITTANIMADSLLISMFLEDNGVVINKATVNSYINNSPQFQTAEGKFDKTFYKDYITQLGFSEPGFIMQQISLLKTNFFLLLMEAISFSELEELAKKIIKAQKQKREIQLIKVPITASSSKNFEYADMEAYYEAHKEEFSIEEKRDITFAKLNPETVSNILKPSDYDLKFEYRKKYLLNGAKVTFEQVSFLHKEEAQSALPKMLDNSLKGNLFSNIIFEDLAPDIREQFLRINEGQITPIFYSAGQYHILKLKQIHPKSNVQPFEKIKPKLIEQYKESQFCPQIEKMAAQITEDLESGDILSNVIPSGISISNMNISASSNNLLPENIKSLIIEDTDLHYAKLVKSYSSAASPSCEYYAYKIDKIIPKSYISLEEAIPRIQSHIASIKGKNEAREKAIAESDKMKNEGLAMILERKNTSLFNEDILNAIFILKEGEKLPVTISADGRFYLAIRLNKINNISTDSIQKTEIEKMIKTIKESQKDETLRIYLLALREKYKLSINYSSLGEHIK